MNDQETPLESQVPDFLNRNEVHFDTLERDMKFVVEKVDKRPPVSDYIPTKYKPSQPKFVPNSEIEEATNRVAEQAKTIVSQTSGIVRKAISELQRELKELDDILVAHEQQSHQMIDDHLRVSTEAATAVTGIRQQFEFWRSKVK